MVDDNYNDEYEFGDLDSLNPEPIEEETLSSSNLNPPPPNSGNPRRNIFIAIAIIVILMIAYKFLSHFIPSKGNTSDVMAPVSQIAPPPPKPIVVPQVMPVAEPLPPPAPMPENNQTNERLSTVEASQANLRDDLNSTNSQLSVMNSNMSDLANKIMEMNQTLANLVSRLDQQSAELSALTEKARPKYIPKKMKKAPPRVNYYIQAIIPGRAWLIAENGSTITVREGSSIPSYGIVRLIDSQQGKVLTSSGRIIRFSQHDS